MSESTHVTDDHTLDVLRTAILDGTADDSADDGTPWADPVQWVDLVIAPAGDPDLPPGAYVQTRNAYGQEVTHYWPDAADARTYFDAVTCDFPA